MKNQVTRGAGVVLFAATLILVLLVYSQKSDNANAQNVQAQDKQATASQGDKPFDQAQALDNLRKAIAGREDKPAEEVFKNIQMLKGMPAGRLLRVMEMGYARSLGVDCTHCHVLGQWEKEDKPTKQIARDMAANINNEQLKKIKNLKGPNPIVNFRHWTHLQSIAVRRSRGISLFSRSCRIFSLLALFVCAFAGASQTANACSCAPKPTVLDAYEDSDVVIIGRITSVEKVEGAEKENYVDGVRSATLVVEKVYKGNFEVRDEIVFGQGGGADCIWTFDEESVGVQFLFYLHSPRRLAELPYLPARTPDQWFAFGCGRSGGIRGATDDLLYLDNMAKVQGKTRISGRVGGWQNPDINVDGKTIRIIGEKKTYETKTNAAGIFEIYDLPPGKYLIEPETPQGWKIDPYWTHYSPRVAGDEYGPLRLQSPKQLPILLEPKKHAGVEIVFAMDNVARGMVMDPRGKPMAGVCVYLLAPGQEKSGRSDCTDEKGRFEITSVSPGEYVLAANADGKLSEREPFPRLYYPNVSERERAAVITIGPGDAINDLNIVVPKLEETITVTGILRYADGKPVAEKWVKFTATSADENVSGDVNEKTDSRGRFSLKLLKGLTGELVAEDWLLEGLYKSCPKVDELIKESGSNSTTVYSNTIKLETKQNVYNVELVLPFPRCEKAKE